MLGTALTALPPQGDQGERGPVGAPGEQGRAVSVQGDPLCPRKGQELP